MKLNEYICLKVGKETKESYLLKSVLQKLFKAKDVQDPNFKSRIPKWNGEKKSTEASQQDVPVKLL